jgi:hypothetical protein
MLAQVKELVKAAYQRAKRVLSQHEKDLHVLAKELLDKETLSGEQIKKLLNLTSQVWVSLGFRVLHARTAPQTQRKQCMHGLHAYSIVRANFLLIKCTTCLAKTWWRSSPAGSLAV